MTSDIVTTNQADSPFDSIRKYRADGSEYWSARELMAVLTYAKWQNFEYVIEMAKQSVETINSNSFNHFLPRRVKSGGRPSLDYLLSRLAVESILKYSDSSLLYPRSKGRSERVIQHDLAKSVFGAKTEVKTLAGNIDILGVNEIIEVKKIDSWKHAVGQIIIYGHYYPSHKKRIHLYGESQESFLAMISKHCEKLSIIVSWEP